MTHEEQLRALTVCSECGQPRPPQGWTEAGQMIACSRSGGGCSHWITWRGSEGWEATTGGPDDRTCLCPACVAARDQRIEEARRRWAERRGQR